MARRMCEEGYKGMEKSVWNLCGFTEWGCMGKIFEEEEESVVKRCGTSCISNQVPA